MTKVTYVHGKGFLHLYVPGDVDNPSEWVQNKVNEINEIDGVEYRDDTGFFGLEKHPNFGKE